MSEEVKEAAGEEAKSKKIKDKGRVPRGRVYINQIMGIKRGMTYIFLVVLIATVSGYTFGIMIA